MKKKKKNSFWTFIFSLLPGAAEMYMGFMKMGFSLMTMFAVVLVISTMLEVGAFIFFAAIIWFYGFFHARNLAGLDETELEQVEDEYLFVGNDINPAELGKKYRRLIAAVLIIVGIAALWNCIYGVIYSICPPAWEFPISIIGHLLPKVAIAVIVIVFGIKMIFRA